MGSFFRGHQKFILVLVILVLVLSLVNLADSFFPDNDWGQGIIIDVISFFTEGIDLVSDKISSSFSVIFNYSKVKDENSELKEEVKKLNWKIQRLKEVEKENKRLRSLLKFKERVSFEVMGAKVISKSADNWSRLITINRGSNSGLKPKMLVVTYDGYLVGRVKKVTTYNAQVLLLSDPNFTIGGLVAKKESREIGIVNGTLNQRKRLKMKRLPWDAEVKVDDKVITSGLSDTYPKGIAIGEITEVKPDDYGLTKLAILQPFVDLNTFEEVLVITDF
ncbi:rod shape-determining protein MreC [Sporohalobacter salinus]|uniref:rod shape-determining protein MreC n=1 Tax=Sporohalobacter salinus TaxID=1494606 RepID=UPI001960F4CD|nr:rod shape-determining protein MreC [Sporohalobacter salinus]MBM7623096.1 rod shape-determining protein MreC [Sporohalobacter salinus]